MLSYQNRLISKKDIEAVCRRGSFFSSGNVTLRVKKNEESGTRFGFSVGLKFSLKAVERNRAKRQLRESARQNIATIKKGYDIFAIVKKGQKMKQGAEELAKDFLEALKKGNLIS